MVRERPVKGVANSCALEDEAGPLNYSRLAAKVQADGVGRMFDSARGYRERVGRLLFGLPLDEYDELLLLLDRLAKPEVGGADRPQAPGQQLVLLRPSLTTDPAVRPRAGWRAAGRVACTP